MLLIALTCFNKTKNNNIFPPKKKKKEKKDMQIQQQCSGGCQGFWKKYYPKRSAGVEIFFKTRRA